MGTHGFAKQRGQTTRAQPATSRDPAKPRTALVTGATGFLGLNLVRGLLAQGWDVTALHLPGDDLRYLSRFSVQATAGDILDTSSVTQAMAEGVDAVFHLAGDTSTWNKHADRQYAVNVVGTAHVCQAALAKHATRLIHTSSSSAFGCHDTTINEATRSNASTCGISYHRSKYLGEQEVRAAVDRGLDAVILNPCNVIGPYDTGNWSQLICAVARRELPGVPPGTGTFSHVDDIAAAHIAAFERGRRGERYLLGGVKSSFREVIAAIARVADVPVPRKELTARQLRFASFVATLRSWLTGHEPRLNPAKVKRLVGTLSCDDSKAVHELGFRSRPIRTMVADCHAWLVREGLLSAPEVDSP